MADKTAALGKVAEEIKTIKANITDKENQMSQLKKSTKGLEDRIQSIKVIFLISAISSLFLYSLRMKYGKIKPNKKNYLQVNSSKEIIWSGMKRHCEMLGDKL